MKDLGCLVQAISRQKLRKLDLLGDEVLGTRRTKLRALYDGLHAGTFRTDRDAARALYNAGPTDARWRQLKSRFRKKLLNTLLLVDVAHGDTRFLDHDALHTAAHRDLTQLLLLSSAGAKEEAAGLARTLFNRATTEDLPDIVLACGAQLLSSFKSTSTKYDSAARIADGDNASALRDFQRTLANASTCMSAIVEAESLLLDVLTATADRPDGSVGALNDSALLRLGARLDRLVGKYQQPRLRYAHAEAWVAIAVQLQQPALTLKVVSPLLELAAQNPSRAIFDRLAPLATAAALAHSEIGQWPVAQKLLMAQMQQSLHVAPFDAQSERAHELYLRCALDVGDHKAAWDQCLTIVSGAAFKQASTRDRQRWFTRMALTYALLSNAGAVELPLHVQRGMRSLGTTEQGLRAEAASDTWWALLASVVYARTSLPSALRERVGTLRAFAVKKLDRRLHARELAFTQLLYRRERSAFSGTADAVAERHLTTLLTLPEPQVLAKATPAPCRLTDLLPLFEVSAHRAAA